MADAESSRQSEALIEPVEPLIRFERDIMLPNETRIRIRALHPSEGGVIRDFYAHLSPRTRYLRFFSVMPVLPESVVRLLLGSGRDRQMAIVAESDASDGQQVVALATLAPVGDGTAEVGLAVRDDWQRQRVGTAVAGSVLEAAADLGLHRFIAYVQPENTAIRKLLDNVAVITSVTIRGGVSKYLLERSPSLPASREPVY